MRHSVLLPLAVLLACTPKPTEPAPAPEAPPEEEAAGPTAEDARAFVERANAALKEAWSTYELTNWEYETDLTEENAQAAAAAQAEMMATVSRLIEESRTYADVQGLDAATARAIHLLSVATTLPAPSDPARREELATIASQLSGIYGAGEFCPEEGSPLGTECLDLDGLEDILMESRDWDTQLAAWEGWRTVSPPMRPLYQRFVELGNEGARDLGFADVGAVWRAGYDMPAEDVPAEADRLWKQVEPLYEQLHCYTRGQLEEKYGERMPADGTIPAHVTGNMWAQDWSNLYPLLEPNPGASGVDVTAALESQEYDAKKMVRTAEDFFVSLGLDPLPDTFWERSMFVQPEDREVVCHASAWDPHYDDDLRIKMCIDPTAEDFETIHHELGHLYYFHAYHELPTVFQQGAHDGFHEAIGDTIALSITPAYLEQIGLTEAAAESEEAVINEQMRVALAKVAFLPFGRMIDQWRWDVFSGETGPEAYNAAWWEVREAYQGISAPGERTEEHFDPGAKYHIPANTPYLRYFFAHILQFQLHEALCEAAGHQGPLHTCSIYGSEEAGDKLQAMLALGASQPWPDALQAVAGTRQMDAAPLVEYFAPLQAWLEEQNAGRQCGWTEPTPEPEPAPSPAPTP